MKMNKNEDDFRNRFGIFSRKFWYIPSDVVQRSLETNLWKDFFIKHPVLEIGCGDGEISKLVFSGINQIDSAVDIDSNAIIKAINCGYYKKVICADSESLPFKSNSFKTVIANSTFEHIENLDSSLSEAYRVLKKGGQFVFSVPLKAFKFNIIKNFGKVKSGLIDIRLGHINYYSKAEWLRMLESSGFKEIKTQKYFSDKVLKLWYRFFKIYTFKIGNSELWSLIKNYFEDKLCIKNIFIKILTGCVSSIVVKNENKGKKLMIFFSCYK